mmetsp:Transcript_15483/g.34569  ORF Transcript_15483/g.34569 Transcript_15483/m.34569 type:complete len:181 (-) Transcript_15483:47-589(-)
MSEDVQAKDTCTAGCIADAATSTNERFLIKVSGDMPTLEECHSFVNLPSCGAISSFTGITRDNFQGKTVNHLSYEGYVPMAEKELRKLCDEATSKFTSIGKIAAVHILGDCPVGSASVILCASSPHRKEAMHCVEFLIDELKAKVPIWKMEVYEGDDGRVWKENIEWKEGKPKRVMVRQD